MRDGYLNNVPRATKKETEELENILRVPTTTKVKLLTVGKKYITALVIIGGEWQEIKFFKDGFLKVVKNNNLIQEVNRKELLLQVAH